jgi:hypothetical protein
MFVRLSLFILQNTWLNEAIRIYGHFGPFVHYGGDARLNPLFTMGACHDSIPELHNPKENIAVSSIDSITSR